MESVGAEIESRNILPCTALPKSADATAIQNLVAAYFQRTDRPGIDPVSELFAQAGTLALGNMVITGRASIALFFEERNLSQSAVQRVTRHMSGGIELTAMDADRVAGRSTALVFAGEGQCPLPTGAPSTICDFDDIYVRTSGGWLFEERRATVIFTGAGAAAFAK